jgi:hypothetical protein
VEVGRGREIDSLEFNGGFSFAVWLNPDRADDRNNQQYIFSNGMTGRYASTLAASICDQRLCVCVGDNACPCFSTRQVVF